MADKRSIETDLPSVQIACDVCQAFGCKMNGSFSCGYVLLRDAGKIVLTARQPAPFAPWEVKRFDSPRIQWRRD